MASPHQARVLNSWKEIAAHLGRGVRTAQRCERELHLPVHRPKGRVRSAVIAFPEELDMWLHAAPTRLKHSLDAMLDISNSVEVVLRNKNLDKNVSAVSNEMLLRLTEMAQEQNQRARTMLEQIRVLRQKAKRYLRSGSAISDR